MICNNCHKKSNHVKLFSDGSEACNFCLDIPEASGPKTDNILTQNSFRIRTEAIKNEGDTILPHAHDRARRTLGINSEFIKLYPDRAKDFFTPEEMVKGGMPKLAKKAIADKQKAIEHKRKLLNSVEHTGDPKKAIERVLSP